MLDIKSLPNDPIEALLETLSYCISKAKGNANIGTLRNNNNLVATELTIACAIARKSATHLTDDDLRSIIVKNLQLHDDENLDHARVKFEIALNATIAYQLDSHFIDQEAVELFDRAKLSTSEKADIRDLMATTRRLVDRSETLSERQRKNVLYHVSKIENELHKEKSSFQTFLAAAQDISSLVRRVGEDVQPIAEAIEKARTITEKKVEGRLAIEEDKKKMLPKPTE